MYKEMCGKRQKNRDVQWKNYLRSSYPIDDIFLRVWATKEMEITTQHSPFLKKINFKIQSSECLKAKKSQTELLTPGKNGPHHPKREEFLPNIPFNLPSFSLKSSILVLRWAPVWILFCLISLLSFFVKFIFL